MLHFQASTSPSSGLPPKHFHTAKAFWSTKTQWCGRRRGRCCLLWLKSGRKNQHLLVEVASWSNTVAFSGSAAIGIGTNALKPNRCQSHVASRRGLATSYLPETSHGVDERLGPRHFRRPIRPGCHVMRPHAQHSAKSSEVSHCWPHFAPFSS